MKHAIEISQLLTNRWTFRTWVGLLGLAACLGVIPLPGGNLSPGVASEKKTEVRTAKSSWLGPIIKMNPLIVNLNEPGGRHYLKTTIILELSRMEWVEEVQEQIPCLTDMVITTLGDKKLADMQKPEIKEEIRKELLAKAQKTPAGGMIKQIYFDEFLFQ
jgi:flagellar FliL protein